MNRPKRYTKEVLLNSALIGLKLSICTASLFSGHPVFVSITDVQFSTIKATEIFDTGSVITRVNIFM